MRFGEAHGLSVSRRLSAYDGCRFPNDWIQKKPCPLFLAYELLQGLIGRFNIKSVTQISFVFRRWNDLRSMIFLCHHAFPFLAIRVALHGSFPSTCPASGLYLFARDFLACGDLRIDIRFLTQVNEKILNYFFSIRAICWVSIVINPSQIAGPIRSV